MENPVVAFNFVVAISYKLFVEGDLYEDVKLLEYIQGRGTILRGLEKALEGKRVGDTFIVELKPEDAQGLYDENQLEVLPREHFRELETIAPGTKLKLVDADNDAIDAVVREINEERVVLDFNRPLAGKTLTFEVTVILVRKPTYREDKAGLTYSALEKMSYTILEG